MEFQAFCETLSQIEQTTLRLEMTKKLAELFRELSPTEVEPACYMLLGRLRPHYENIEFNFAGKMLIRSIAEFVTLPKKDTKKKLQQQMSLVNDLDITDARIAIVKKTYAQRGDLGDTAGAFVSSVMKDTRSVSEVYASLLALAKHQGEGSQERKQQAMVELFKQSSAFTARYIVRIVLGTLRLGFSDMTMLDALSWSKTGDKSLRKQLEEAYQIKADVGKVAKIFLKDGVEGLQHIEIELGIPISPALCQRLKTADEMIEKMGKVFVEPKYDGTRVLIHVHKRGKDWQIRTFTRNLEESSGMFPELKASLDVVKVDDVILDSEAVGYDPETDKLLPFQQTLQRKRKHDIEATARRVPLRFFVFDVLYYQGKSLLQVPLYERKALLPEIFSSNATVFVQAPYIVTDSAKELRAYHAKQLGEGLEGAVIKQYASVYQPGRRGWSWVKFKEEEGTTGKLSDTIDCVVMGYYVGKGKRTKFGVGAFLVGVRNAKDDSFRTIAKIGTGLTDVQWGELYDRCTVLKVATQPKEYLVDEQLEPDVWIRPSLVVEIAADELTNSPIHTAEKALRFPRLVKFRDDKTPEQVTSVQELTTY